MTRTERTPDRKMRFGGLLENPYLSKWQRGLMDFGRWQGIAGVLGVLKLRSVLDVGCGLGENSRACAHGYVGIDNSAPRIFYAAGHYPSARFILGDGLGLPVKPRSFDMVMLLDTSHHLTDAQLIAAVGSMTAASRAWVLVSDAILFDGQSALSRFCYRIDRGAEFRSAASLQALLLSCLGLTLERVTYFTTFPGIYRRASFLLKVAV